MLAHSHLVFWTQGTDKVWLALLIVHQVSVLLFKTASTGHGDPKGFAPSYQPGIVMERVSKETAGPKSCLLTMATDFQTRRQSPPRLCGLRAFLDHLPLSALPVKANLFTHA